MTDDARQPDPSLPEPRRYTGVRAYVKLARPTQWSKSVFVVVGPLYGWSQGLVIDWISVLWAVVAFSLASSGLYVINDWFDREKDRVHPRKRHRPLASGSVSPRAGLIYAGVLLGFSAGAVLMLDAWHTTAVVGALTAMHALNVLIYSAYFKNKVILDVLSLAMGFVLRVLAGCAAAEIEPSTWLLNATLFLSMFLAFGKRLGEKRTLGEDASAARSVQLGYSDVLLQMAVVVTAVATLLTYAGYVQSRAGDFTVKFGSAGEVGPAAEALGGGGFGLNLLWLTVLPSTLALLRAMVQLERGTYDDPTELAVHDAVVRVCAVGFVALTVLAVVFSPGS
jgi:4-hydroxybenzoate polyprenyltransferase